MRSRIGDNSLLRLGARFWLATALSIIAVSTPAAAGTYFSFDLGPQLGGFLDRDSLSGPPSGRTVWEYVAYADDQTLPASGKTYVVLAALEEWNCEDRTYRTTSSIAYTSEGEAVSSDDAPTGWKDAAPSSNADKIRELVCTESSWPSAPFYTGSLRGLRDEYLKGLGESSPP
jgi:hypothetical protein